MASSISTALQRIKRDPHACISPSIVENVCTELGLQWRNTELTPPLILALLAQQVLAGNVSNPELLRRAGLKVTAAAYCTAKGRLPLEVVEQISRRVCAAVAAPGTLESRGWKGHRTWHVDGSNFSMPDTPELQEHFGQSGRQKPGCGFPVAHLLCLFDASTGLIRDVAVSPLRTHDLSPVPRLHPHLQPGDILIGDSAFGSFFHLLVLQEQGVFGVFPCHQGRIVNFQPGRTHAPPGKDGRKGQPTSRWVKTLGQDDQLVEYFKPRRCPPWMSRQRYDASPPSLLVREIRRTIHRKGFRPRMVVIVTTLLDPVAHPADEIVALLGERWNVETNLRHLKTTMNMEILRCQSVAGVLKELWTFILIYNLTRLIMMEAAGRQKVPLSRISFADALYWMRYVRAGEDLPDLIVNLHRPDRVEPRALKRRPKQYHYMNRPRHEFRMSLRSLK